MRRSPAGFLAGLAAGAGALLLFRRRLLRRRKPGAQAPDPAEELKRKLDESRAVPAEPEPAAEPHPEPSRESLADRRRQVHERGRGAIDRMRGRPEQD